MSIPHYRYRFGPSMLSTEYRLNEDFVASDVVRWYQKVPLGAQAVIMLPEHPRVRIYSCPNEQVYWCTEGRKGMTLSLDDAQQRLAMFQTQWRMHL